MLKKQLRTGFLTLLCVLLFATGCTGSKPLVWRADRLVAQLYRQYKEELLLAYNDFDNQMHVDDQRGYAKAYFDNYRKEIIFTKERTLDYLVNGTAMSTASADVTGYPADILVNETYQLAVEILDVRSDQLTSNEFDGAKSRIINLNTGDHVIVDGLLFNRSLLIGDYFYGFTFDNNYAQLFDIVNVKTMQHHRIKRSDNKFTFIYARDQDVYVQVANEETAFLIDGFALIETKERYDANLPNFEHGAQVLKDIAPRETGEHWYIEPPSEDDPVVQGILLFRVRGNDPVNVTKIRFAQHDVMQVMDVSAYRDDQLALFLMKKDDAGDFHAIITIFDMHGNEQRSEEITTLLRGDVGRFTHLDYVE